MEIRNLGHAGLLVRDVERSRYFYSQVLGMEEIPRPSNFDFPGAWLHKGGALIHLVGGAERGHVDQIYSSTYCPVPTNPRVYFSRYGTCVIIAVTMTVF
jgi:catechol 2,3-dioxygenase-like lactoylglutathione lyase family enzyme